jgi:UDP-GlcNAc:undecaprenyl-phosphate GlcNAc-1-phosphate transferase
MLYILTFTFSFVISLFSVFVFRKIALKLNILDRPNTPVKTHKMPVPYLGGLGIYLGLIVSLLIIRHVTHFPTGTLRSIRGIFLGSALIVLLGLIDDIKPGGLKFGTKFLIQFIAAIAVINYDIRIKFITPQYIGILFTILWIVGVTNAVNIIDIMDGLAGCVSFISALAFFFISLPSEDVYVNFVSISLAGSILGFLPYNISQRYKIFMGDTGSLLIGFVLSALALGARYTHVNNIALYVPILVLLVPIFDTFFVSYHRIKRGKNPFIGTKDHYALRLEKVGYTRRDIVLYSCLATLCLSVISFIITKANLYIALLLYALVAIFVILVSKKLSSIEVED